MAEARSQDAWSHTSSVMALIANCHRDPKKGRAFKPADFSPFAPVEKKLKAPVSVLRDIFVPKKPPKE